MLGPCLYVRGKLEHRLDGADLARCQRDARGPVLRVSNQFADLGKTGCVRLDANQTMAGGASETLASAASQPASQPTPNCDWNF